MKKKEKTLLILQFIFIGFIAFCGVAVLIDAILNPRQMRLGNLIERITYYTGIKYIWKKIYPNCKCKERQENLNDIELWQKIN